VDDAGTVQYRSRDEVTLDYAPGYRPLYYWTMGKPAELQSGPWLFRVTVFSSKARVQPLYVGEQRFGVLASVD
jgi:hypothetical protein